MKHNPETHVTPFFTVAQKLTDSSATNSICCDAIELNDAINHLRKLSAIAIPDDSCLYDLFADLYVNRHYSMYTFRPLSWRTIPHMTNTKTLHMNIRANLNDATVKCDKLYCIQNIASGKCRDKFVIENIGKVFFADKYNAKTR